MSLQQHCHRTVYFCTLVCILVTNQIKYFDFILFRIRTETNGGAWCPTRQIANGVKEYLEIDFAGEYRISQTETQGRFGNGLGREFVEQFHLEYWRDSLSRWIPYKDHLGRTVRNRVIYVLVIRGFHIKVYGI